MTKTKTNVIRFFSELSNTKTYFSDQLGEGFKIKINYFHGIFHGHWALDLKYVPLQDIYQVFGYGYSNIVLRAKMSQRNNNKHL